MTQVSTRQRVLDFIKRFREAKGYAPTVREIAEECGISSPSVVQYHLERLERSGHISRGREKFRSISVVGHRSTVPVLGVIAAGRPIPVPDAVSMEEADRWVNLPDPDMAGRRDLYALEVRGNSMVDAMIAEGDIVIMEQTYDVKNGDVVAVWLKNEQEVTLKKIYFQGESIRLQPCNPYMLPAVFNANNIEVQGRVVAVIRVNR